MQIEVLVSKIHRVRLTGARLDYVGSIAIDEALLSASGIQVHQKVQVVNLNNGERLETYVLGAAAGSGEISLNGAAARKGMVGDMLLVIAYGWMSPEELKDFQPKVIFPDPNNQLKS